MSQLRILYYLLKEEYAVSRHLWWLDETSGQWVNDVIYTLHLIHQAAKCIRQGKTDCWEALAAYAIERSMSALLIHAIGEYLLNCGQLDPLPLIDLSLEKYRNWRGGEVPLLDETDPLFLHAATERPEPDREIAFKADHRWSRSPWRIRDEHPLPETQTVSKSVHWLF